MSSPSTSVARLTERESLAEGSFFTVKPASYRERAYFICSKSILLKVTSVLFTKSFQFFFSLGDQRHSAMARPRGHIMYLRWRVLYTCSVQRLPCPPLMR